MRTRLWDRLDRALSGALPELRLFLRSDAETRYVRLRPTTQAAGILAGAFVFGWAMLASAILMVATLGASPSPEQVARDRAAFEARLDALSDDRDAALAAAVAAEARFAAAMAEVAAMQSRLLVSDEARREAETGLDVVQATLRRAIRERDEARAETGALRAAAAGLGGPGSAEALAAAEAADVLASVAHALDVAAVERDLTIAEARAARAAAEAAALDLALLEDRTTEVLGRIDAAMTAAAEPLALAFRSVGLRGEDLARAVRGASEPARQVASLRFSTRGAPAAPAAGPAIGPTEARADAILAGIERIALYRAAAARVPFANPVRGTHRFTSGFGWRRDPKTGGRRMHAGADFAAARGTPIHATGDGVVTEAGWHAGFGKMVVIEHAFGLETLYAHLSKIRVREGQRVSRGDRIGDMGNTGRSTGTHLHYEVRTDGTPVNPMPFIKAANDVF